MMLWRQQYLSCLMVLGGSLSLAHGGQLVSSSVFQMTIGPSSFVDMQESMDAIESSIASTLLEFSTSEEQVIHMEARVQDIDESARRLQSSDLVNSFFDVDFKCIGSFRDDQDTAFLDALIFETFSSLTSVKRFKRLLDSSSQADFSGIRTVVVIPLSQAENASSSSSGKSLNKLDVALIVISASVLLVMVVMFLRYRKERARALEASDARRRQSRCRNDRRCAPTDQEQGAMKKKMSTMARIHSPTTRRSLDMDPIYLETATPRESTGPCSSGNNDLKVTETIDDDDTASVGLSEAFSRNCFRSKEGEQESDLDSADDVFHVGKVVEQVHEDEVLGAKTVLLDWARYIQVIRSDTIRKRVEGSNNKNQSNKQNEGADSTKTSSTDRHLSSSSSSEEGSHDVISLDETSASGISETGSLQYEDLGVQTSFMYP